MTSMPPRSRLLLLALLLAPLLAAACAPHVPMGALAPASARGSNEARAADLQVMAELDERLTEQMMAADAAEHRDRATLRALAMADAWLGFARDEYVRAPASPVVDAAFAQARLLVDAVERGDAPASAASLIVGTARSHPELWAQLAQVEADSMSDPVLLGETAVMLIRASRVPLPGDTTVCDPAPFVARTAQHLAVMMQARAPARPSLVVQAEARPVPARRPVAVRAVYFALDSDTIGPAGQQMLDALVAALDGIHGATITLQGYADPRGSLAYNVELSRRRAMAVQAYIASRTMAVSSFEVQSVGRARPSADGGDRAGLARDRRVDLRVVLPDGTEATRSEAVESDLQVEAERRIRRARSAVRRPE